MRRWKVLLFTDLVARVDVNAETGQEAARAAAEKVDLYGLENKKLRGAEYLIWGEQYTQSDATPLEGDEELEDEREYFVYLDQPRQPYQETFGLYDLRWEHALQQFAELRDELVPCLPNKLAALYDQVLQDSGILTYENTRSIDATPKKAQQ